MDLLLHDYTRRDGVHRLVAVYASNNYLGASAWSIATLSQPSNCVRDDPQPMVIILPSGGSFCIRGIADPVNSNHLLLHATVAGTPPTEGTIDIILHNDDTIDLHPSFGWTSNDSHHLWAPAGKPSDADIQAQQ